MLTKLGRMTYNHDLKKAVADHDFGMKVFVFEKEPHSDLLRKCVHHTFPEDPGKPGTELYLGDASGHMIGGDSLTVVDKHGQMETVPWCLAMYCAIRGKKYPSKLKFTIVQKLTKPEGKVRMRIIWLLTL